jgi:tetratricopeptide (TPR) repeat protein
MVSNLDPKLIGSPFVAFAQQVPAFGAALNRHETGDLAAARTLYLDLIDHPALTAICLHQLGLIASARGEHTRAVELLRRSIKLDPSQPISYHNLRTALERAGDHGGALTALLDLGCILYNQQDFSQAAKVFLDVLASDPLNYAAHVNLGIWLSGRGKKKPAARHLLLGIELFGRLVKEVGTFICMIEDMLDGWLDVRPNNQILPVGMPTGVIERAEEALTMLGKLLNEAGKVEAGILCLRKSIEIAPGFAFGHWNLSMALLASGQFDEGWTEYEWRWHWDRFPEPRRILSAPYWRGENLKGKSILIWTEQGPGEAFQFSPLLNHLVDLGAKVYFEVPLALMRLFRNSYPNVTIIPRPDNLNQINLDETIDYILPQMSLPLRLSLQREDLPIAVNYIKSNEADEKIWDSRLPLTGKPRIGIIWTDLDVFVQDDEVQSVLTFSKMAPLLTKNDVIWHSLQLGSSRSDIPFGSAIEDMGGMFNDFADMAAAINQLDLVIAVPTPIAHLAAGVGVSVWLMTEHYTDWTWLGTDDQCDWYPNAKLFSRKKYGEWEKVIEAISLELDSWIQGWFGQQS